MASLPVLTGKTGLQQTGEKCKDGQDKLTISVEEDKLREHLNKLDIKKSMGPDEWHP